ncbi:FAD-dependent monooxygenase [Nakamurella deserti]|uniref:FAD-dependent monooxygenase n=1 Tax=Nakamurella deserti TaxID=2164074 RepID=UPI000DBE73C1|nr:FAD-dependent monooxygenase [Nakamurella deserti]
MARVMVVGAGPAGMMLAAELRLAGVEAVVLDERESAGLVGSRGGGIHARSIELLDQRGLAGRFLAAGRTLDRITFGGTALALGGLPTRHPYTLALFQNEIERLLAERLDELGVRVRRGTVVTGLTVDDDGVTVHREDGDPLRADWVVGADGGRSTVRRAAGIDFPGVDATRSTLIADVRVTGAPVATGKVDARGVHGLHPMGDGTVRVVVTEAVLQRGRPTLDDLRRELTAVFGTDFGVHDPSWLSRFTDATRQAATYRSGRVLLAGDAAHVHSPTGGMGIGLGLQDAVNLGWKLARVVHGVADPDLLDTYTAERHPAGARALRYTMAQSLFQQADPRREALRELLDEVLAVPDAGTPIAALVTGLDVRHDPGNGHPLWGRRMPDLDLDTADGPRRLYSLLHHAEPLLLALDDRPLPAAAPWVGRVRRLRAGAAAEWVLPVVGAVPAPGAVFVRPDGHVGWVGGNPGGGGGDEGLTEALATWCGRPG